MPLFDRPPIDAISVSNTLFSSGTFRITGGPQITVGSDASGAVLSAGVIGSFFENAIPDPDTAQSGLAQASVNASMAGGRLIVQPVSPSNELFPMNITVTRMDLNFSGADTTSNVNASAAFTSSFMLGFYTRANSTQLSLLNSVLLSTAAGASTANYSRSLGARYLSMHSSLFSSQPVFTEGGRYWFAQLIRTSGAMYTTASHLMQFGMYQGATIQRSGQLGAASSGNTSFNAWYPFMGVHSNTTLSAMPASLAHSDLNKASSLANWIPHLLMNGGLAPLE